MRKTVVCQLALGRTRVSGYTLYDHERMAFEETTPRDVKHLIKNGVVNGLRLDIILHLPILNTIKSS